MVSFVLISSMPVLIDILLNNLVHGIVFVPKKGIGRLARANHSLVDGIAIGREV